MDDATPDGPLVAYRALRRAGKISPAPASSLMDSGRSIKLRTFLAGDGTATAITGAPAVARSSETGVSKGSVESPQEASAIALIAIHPGTPDARPKYFDLSCPMSSPLSSSTSSVPGALFSLDLLLPV